MKELPIAAVLERHTDEIMDVPGVTGVGEGAENGKPVIVVFVVKRTPEIVARLPKELEGYKVVVRESGEVEAQPQTP